MGSRAPDDAIAMERRHLLEGEARVARQRALVDKLTEEGNDQGAENAKDLLRIMLESLEISRTCLLRLEVLRTNSR
jgi:hypothetical protein